MQAGLSIILNALLASLRREIVRGNEVSDGVFVPLS